MTEHWTVEQYRTYKVTGKKPDNATTNGAITVTIGKGDKPAKGPNKTELEYRQLLELRIKAGTLKTVYPHESIKFKIGDGRCWYTPDFIAVNDKGQIECHEVKGGHVWDDASVKFKSAKRQYPDFVWYWSQKKEGVWGWE